jgi:hypothetical protein
MLQHYNFLREHPNIDPRLLDILSNEGCGSVHVLTVYGLDVSLYSPADVKALFRTRQGVPLFVRYCALVQPPAYALTPPATYTSMTPPACASVTFSNIEKMGYFYVYYATANGASAAATHWNGVLFAGNGMNSTQIHVSYQIRPAFEGELHSGKSAWFHPPVVVVAVATEPMNMSLSSCSPPPPPPCSLPLQRSLETMAKQPQPQPQGAIPQKHVPPPPGLGRIVVARQEGVQQNTVLVAPSFPTKLMPVAPQQVKNREPEKVTFHCKKRENTDEEQEVAEEYEEDQQKEKLGFLSNYDWLENDDVDKFGEMMEKEAETEANGEKFCSQEQNKSLDAVGKMTCIDLGSETDSSDDPTETAHELLVRTENAEKIALLSSEHKEKNNTQPKIATVREADNGSALGLCCNNKNDNNGGTANGDSWKVVASHGQKLNKPTENQLYYFIVHSRSRGMRRQSADQVKDWITIGQVKPHKVIRKDPSSRLYRWFVFFCTEKDALTVLQLQHTSGRLRNCGLKISSNVCKYKNSESSR